jgi:zinc/manganese transport system ATP-binding protein
VELQAAAVGLGGRDVWRDVTLSVDQGEFVAILGPNGAGKSTLLKVILGLLPLSAGSVRVLGGRPGAANAAIGYLPQRRSFGADLRVRGRDVVSLGLDGARWGSRMPLLDRAFRPEHHRAAARRIDDVLELVGAQGYANRPIGECSGGEQQRLLIAQALVGRPQLLILDEPLDSLDPSNQQSVSALIQRICLEQGVTVLLVAHDVNPILRYLDRVIYIASGRAVLGAPQEVITTETLTRLYGVPIEVLRASDGRLVVVGQPDAPAHGAH